MKKSSSVEPHGILVIYDIEQDKIRNKIITVCKDYGLERIQYSCFLGNLTNNLADEMTLKLDEELEERKEETLGRIHIFHFDKPSLKKTVVLGE